MGSSQARARTYVPCIGRRILNHCATREARVVCFLILSCITYLYNLHINSYLVVSFEKIFSHSGGCLFILWVVFFAMQKLSGLIRSHLFIFASVSFALVDFFLKKRNICIFF